MTKPNFMIIGAAKCGTTSLHSYLQGHPDIYMSEPKEPCFFCRPWPQEEGLPETEEEYFDLFRGGRGVRAIGEASANYLFVPEAPQRIYDTLGDSVKLVVMLRNPVSMMYSLWEHATRGGWENRDVQEALLASRIDEALTIQTRDSFWTTLYMRRANYVEQLERYFTLFPRENIKIYLFEEFYSEGYPLYRDLLRFLEVDETHTPEWVVLNKGIGLYNRQLNAFFHRVYPQYVFPVIRHFVPHVVRKSVKSWIVQAAVSHGRRQNTSVREALHMRLNDSVRQLEKVMGRDLSRVWF